MSEQLYPLTQTLFINAPASKVWEWLTKPECIKQWCMGIEVSCDWQKGSEYRSRFTYEGVECWEKGVILEAEHERYVELSFITSWDGLEDKPENYSMISQRLVPKDGGTELIIVTDSAIKTEEKRLQEEQGWQQILPNLKELIENSLKN